MSLRAQPAPPAVPNRCQLFGPGSRPEIPAKMAASGADVITLDLDASVAPADKARARDAVVAATRGRDWGRRVVSARINGLATPWWHRDVIALIEGGGRLDRIMVPEVGSAADVHAVDALLAAAEAEAERPEPVALEVVIGTAAGLAGLGEIAAASPRLEAISLDAAGLAASMGAAAGHEGGSWDWARSAVVAACRAHGLLPVDGPFVDFADEAGFEAAARRAAALGMAGIWAVHPRQVAAAHAAFTPPEARVAEARAIVEAAEAARARGEAAAVHEGRRLDPAAVGRAESLVRQADLIGAVGGRAP